MEKYQNITSYHLKRKGKLWVNISCQRRLPETIPQWSPKMVFHETASAERLYRNIGVKELVPWIWSGTNHHDISSLCPPEDSRSRGRGTVLKDGLQPVPVCNC